MKVERNLNLEGVFKVYYVLVEHFHIELTHKIKLGKYVRSNVTS